MTPGVDPGEPRQAARHRSGMGLRWGDHRYGFDERGRLSAQVIGYEGRDARHVPRYWIAHLRHHPLPGEWPTAEEAMAVAEAAHEAESGRESR